MAIVGYVNDSLQSIIRWKEQEDNKVAARLR